MIGNLRLNRLLWAITALLSLGAGLAGVLHPQLYARVITPAMVPGAVSQDLVTVAIALLLLISAVTMKEDSVKRQIMVLGLLTYLWYGYGIWVLERMYNQLYLLYVAIFALAFWSLVAGLVSLRRDVVRRLQLAGVTRWISIGWSLLNPLIFVPLWASQLLPLMAAARRIEYYYSIYILDLGFIMPALLILAILSIRQNGLGLLLTPALFVKGFGMLFSVGLGGLIAPLYHQAAGLGETWFYLAMSAVFLLTATLHLVALRVNDGAKPAASARQAGPPLPGECASSR